MVQQESLLHHSRLWNREFPAWDRELEVELPVFLFHRRGEGAQVTMARLVLRNQDNVLMCHHWSQNYWSATLGCRATSLNLWLPLHLPRWFITMPLLSLDRSCGLQWPVQIPVARAAARKPHREGSESTAPVWVPNHKLWALLEKNSVSAPLHPLRRMERGWMCPHTEVWSELPSTRLSSSSD